MIKGAQISGCYELRVWDSENKLHGFRAKRGFADADNRIFGSIGCGSVPGWAHRCVDRLIFVKEGEVCHICAQGWFGAFCEHGNWPDFCDKCTDPHPSLWERVKRFFSWK